MSQRVTNRWTIGEWTFYRIDGNGFGGDLKDKPLFAYGDGSSYEDGRRKGHPRYGELYISLDHAMAAAIAEKYTGRRGAGGTGVGTAADWFMRMIGADLPTRSELIERAAATDAVKTAARHQALSTVAEDCSSEHGVGHPDCPKCWRYSDRNPNQVARPYHLCAPEVHAASVVDALDLGLRP